MIGFFLQGGGAKGAFQAGVITALYEKGIKPNIISATSIGAINGYCLYLNQVEYLKELWMNIDDLDVNKKIDLDRVIENDAMIKKLKNLKSNDKFVDSFFINYVQITKNHIKEHNKNLKKISEIEAIEYIKASSLLPYPYKKEISIKELKEEFDSSKVFEDFKDKVASMMYDGYKLDGAIMNNNFIDPFYDNLVDELYLIVLKSNYEIPQKLLEKYKSKNIHLVKPNYSFKPKDTLKFEPEFCREIFKLGYEQGKEI